ncbi:hypothetical protein LWI29_000530 [Acer saccharum]|uniref:Reverse transcriptase Ty1/copia-type domain-containing protein n=1 Tax=Acer saccharum TaxID=4024 RepID=A0AA39SQ83_ACESA|nr:hypothetical protein LWI29_000530 [Acer saccharum]
MQVAEIHIWIKASIQILEHKVRSSVKGFGFIQNPDEPCVYKRIKGDKLVFLILYVDDILLIGNDVGVLTSVKEWLAKQFDMKDLGEASFILGIQVIRDRKNRTIALSQASYITRSCLGFPCRIPRKVSIETCPDHWTAVKHIFKYLKRTRDNMLLYSGGHLIPVGYTDSDFQSDSDSRKSTSGAVLLLEEEQSYGGVSSNLVLLIPPWKLSMLLHARLQKRLFGSTNS